MKVLALALAVFAGCVPTNHWVASTAVTKYGEPSPADCMDACTTTGVPNFKACASRCGASFGEGGCRPMDRGPMQICRVGDEHASTGWFLVGLVSVTAFAITAALVTENPFGIHTVSPSTGLR